MSGTKREKGTGQITFLKSRNSWRITWLGDDYTINGHRKQYTKTFKKKTDAEKYLKTLNGENREIEREKFISQDWYFNDFIPIYLEEKKEEKLKVRSYVSCETNINRLKPYMAGVRLRDIDNEFVKSVIRDMEKNGRDGKGYSTQTLKKSIDAIKALLRVAEAKKFISRAPLIIFKHAEKEAYTPDKAIDPNNYLRPAEITAYTAECKRTRVITNKYLPNFGCVFPEHYIGYRLLFLLHTGLRLGEALALEVKDYDENSKTIRIDKDIVEHKNEKIVQTPKTKSSVRILVLNKQALDDIRHLLDEHQEQTRKIEERRAKALKEAEDIYSAAELGAAKKRINREYDAYIDGHKYLCSSQRFPYGIASGNGTLQAHKKILKAIGVNRSVSIHGLRHTYATQYYLNHCNDPDFDLAEFSRMLGHASIRTTMEIYTHLNMEEKKNQTRNENDLKDF